MFIRRFSRRFLNQTWKAFNLDLSEKIGKVSPQCYSRINVLSFFLTHLMNYDINKSSAEMLLINFGDTLLIELVKGTNTIILSPIKPNILSGIIRIWKLAFIKLLEHVIYKILPPKKKGLTHIINFCSNLLNENL